jgi:Ulp1 family protease
MVDNQSFSYSRPKIWVSLYCVNQSNSISFKCKLIVLDSIKKEDDGQYYQFTLEIKKFLTVYANVLKKNIIKHRYSLSDYYIGKVPEQENSYDCGYYMLKNIDIILKTNDYNRLMEIFSVIFYCNYINFYKYLVRPL